MSEADELTGRFSRFGGYRRTEESSRELIDWKLCIESERVWIEEEMQI